MQKFTNESQTKKQRSTSVLLNEAKKFPISNNQIEKENTNNLNTNYKKGFHHRKRTSSYFLGSYIQNSDILENNQLNEEEINNCLNINNNLFKNNNEISNDKDEETTSNEIKNKLIYNLINNDNSNNNISVSFPSYDENNNNSIIIKQDYLSNKKNNNNIENTNKNEKYDKNSIFYEMAKISENSQSCKSFISFKNSLKYIKDKDERTTPSYQLALQTDKKNANNNYVTSSNIIEEEKSSMIESKSEFSNKKEIFFFEKKRIENNKDEGVQNNVGNRKANKNNIEENNKNIFDNINIEDINNNFVNNNNFNNSNNIQNYENNKMSLALNEIIIRNNKKEENKRKYLTKNKMALLNTFFTMSKTLQANEDKNKNRNKIENYLIHKEKEKNKEYKDIKEDKNNLDYFTKKKFISKFLKKSFNNKRTCNTIINTENSYLNSMQNLNNNLNLNCQERFSINSQVNQKKNNNDNYENIYHNNLKKNSCKIPHLANVKKKFQQKLAYNSNSNLIETPYKKLKITNLNNNSSIRKVNQRNKNNIQNERNFHTLKRIENLNNALSFIREKKKINKTSSNLDKKKYINNNTCNCSNFKNNKLSGYSTSFFTNSNSNINTQSHSQSKEKNKKPPKVLRKANSGSFNSKGEYLSQSGEEISNIESNKEQIILCLKYKISFNKLYEKIDALEKINSTNFSNKSFFMILCEIKANQFIFSGLFKYYHDKERYIKIYGDERIPNYILLKDIKGKVKYKIYEDNSQINSSISSFILINQFRFTNNAIIIIKN